MMPARLLSARPALAAIATVGGLLLGAGCSSPIQPADVSANPQGGARLKVIAWRSVADGQTVFAGWRDTLKGIDCEMKATGASTAACLPIYEHMQWDTFADPQCRVPVMTFVQGSRDLQITVDQCQPAVRAFRPGPPLRQTTVYHFDWFDGSCTPGAAGPMLQALDDVTAEYAALDIRSGPPAGGIAPRGLFGADGSRAFWSWWDVNRGAACTFPWIHNSWDVVEPWLSDDGSWRCLPTRGLDYVDTFQIQDRFRWGDAQCSTFAAVVPTFAQCQPGRWDYWWGDYGDSSLGCDSRVKVWGLGAVLSTAYHRGAVPMTCDPEPLVRAEAQVRKLDLLDFRPWPTGSLGAPQGEGRLRTRFIETPGGTSMGVLWDAMLDTQCTVAQRADGAMGCLPAGDASGSVNIFYADAACTREAVYASRPCPKPRYYRTLAAGFPPGGHRVYYLEDHTGPVYHKGGSCQLYTPEAATLGRPVGGTWQTIGAEIPSSDLIQLEPLRP
jgi:hypothetical protein